MILFKRLFIVLLLVYLSSCKESFMPQVTTENANYLVVEGFINTGSDSTIINLSRTVLVSNKNITKPELAATITVENDANVSYALKDLGKGSYGSIGLNLDQTKKHRIRIKTSTGVIYISSFVETKISPAIDDVGFEVKTDGIQLYVNTHDDKNQSRYYRWEYYDTWEFYSQYNSVLKTNGTAIVYRKLPEENIYNCYISLKSNNIFLNSTVKLDKDIVNRAPLNFISSGDERISVRYSKLVKQYVLTKEAYDFWEKLRKNTENLGSIFDAQPSQLTGNVHNIANVEEPVIGYIGAGTFTQKRIFIDKSQLPNWPTIYANKCSPPDTLGRKPGDTDIAIKGLIIPIDYEFVGQDQFILAAPAICVDCTLRGTNKKPSFW